MMAASQLVFFYQVGYPALVVGHNGFTRSQGIKKLIWTIGTENGELIKGNIRHIRQRQELPYLFFVPKRKKPHIRQLQILGKLLQFLFFCSLTHDYKLPILSLILCFFGQEQEILKRIYFT